MMDMAKNEEDLNHLTALFNFSSHYRRDVEMYRRMESILLSLQKLMKRVEDTNLAAGSDAYGQTLLVYQAAKMAGKDGSLGPHLDRMGRRFAHKSPGVNQDVTPPAN